MLSHRTGHHKVPGLQPLNLRMAVIPKLRCFIPCGVSFFLYFCLFYFENYNRKIVFNKE